MIKSSNEIPVLRKIKVINDKKLHTYEPTKEFITISTVNKFEGILTEIKIGSRKIIVDTDDLLISAKNCQKTGTDTESEKNLYNRFGIDLDTNHYPQIQ